MGSELSGVGSGCGMVGGVVQTDQTASVLAKEEFTSWDEW